MFLFDMEKVKLERLRQCLRVSELAKKSNLSASTIQRMENGTIKIRSINVAKIAKALGKDIEEFIIYKN